MRPRVMPRTTPETTPITQPNSASYIVYQICSQRDPWAVPCSAHSRIWSQIFDGIEKLKGSITLARASISQRATTAMSSSARLTYTTARRLRAAR